MNVSAFIFMFGVTCDRSRKGAYMFGRIDLCDFVLEHPTISRFHAGMLLSFPHCLFNYGIGKTVEESGFKIPVFNLVASLQVPNGFAFLKIVSSLRGFVADVRKGKWHSVSGIAFCFIFLPIDHI